MLKRLYLQRRRLMVWAFCAVLMFPLLTFSGLAAFHWLVVAAGAVVFCLITTVFAAVFLLLLPRLRTTVEILAVGLLFTSLTSPVVQLLFPFDLIVYFLPFLCAIAASTLLYGKWSDGRGWWLKSKSTRGFKTRLSAKEIWPALAPGLGETFDYHAGLLCDIEPDPDDEDTFNLRYSMGHSMFEHQQITFLSKTPYSHVKYYYMGDVSDKNRSFAEGTWEATLTPTSKGTKVVITEERPAMHPRIGLLYWLEDSLGDKAVSIKSNLEDRFDWSMFGIFTRDASDLA